MRGWGPGRRWAAAGATITALCGVPAAEAAAPLALQAQGEAGRAGAVLPLPDGWTATAPRGGRATITAPVRGACVHRLGLRLRAVPVAEGATAAAWAAAGLGGPALASGMRGPSAWAVGGDAAGARAVVAALGGRTAHGRVLADLVITARAVRCPGGEARRVARRLSRYAPLVTAAAQAGATAKRPRS